MSNIYEVLKEAGEAHPYKIQGQPDTYSKYNEGWSDMVRDEVGIEITQ